MQKVCVTEHLKMLVNGGVVGTLSGQSVPLNRFQARREQLESFLGLLPEGQGHNLALNVLYVPYSLGSGVGPCVPAPRRVGTLLQPPRTLHLLSLSFALSLSFSLSFSLTLSLGRCTCVSRGLVGRSLEVMSATMTQPGQPARSASIGQPIDPRRVRF